MNEKINVNLIIAERAYPLKVNPSEEENVRKAAQMINDKIREFRNKYDADDKQDYLAMVALQLAVENMENNITHSGEESELSEKLSNLEQLLG